MHYILLGTLFLFVVLAGLYLAASISDAAIQHKGEINKLGDSVDLEIDRLRQGLEDLAVQFQPVGAIVPELGLIVNYILPDGPGAGQIRPAIIVRIFDPTPTRLSCVQLQVFMDGAGNVTWNDGAPNVVWKTSVRQGLSTGTWHARTVNRARFADDLAPPPAVDSFVPGTTTPVPPAS